jgi:HK97 family phage major capsid protein
MFPIDSKTLSRFSILSAIAEAAGNGGDFRPGLAMDLSNEIAKRCRTKPQGIYIPLQCLAHRAMTVTTAAGALDHITSSEALNALAPLSVVGRAGATLIQGLHGSEIGMPLESATAPVEWVDEAAGPASPGAPAVGAKVTLTPKTCVGHTDITRSFISQTSIDAEQFVRKSLLRSLAAAIDKAAINGDGVLQPAGLLGNTGIPTIATTAHAPSRANLLAMEYSVDAANVGVTNPAYITTPLGKKYLKTTAENNARWLWQDSQVNGAPAFASNVVPSNLGTNNSAILFGNWSDLIIGTWTAVDLFVDKISLATSGGVRVHVFGTVGIVPAHVESFSKIVDFVTS